MGLTRCEVEIVESQPSKEVANSGDMVGGLGVEDDGVINAHVNMGETIRETVHETLECFRRARSSHGHAEPLKEALRSEECCELD